MTNNIPNAFEIFKESLRIFKKHFFQILILTLLALAVKLAFVFADSLLFGNTTEMLRQTRTLKQYNGTNIYQTYKTIFETNDVSILSYISYYLLTILALATVSIATIRVINNNSGPFVAIQYVLKNFIPIILTEVLAIVIMMLVIIVALLFCLLAILFGKILGSILIMLIATATAVVVLRMSFCAQIYILEEKYYFEAIKLSLKYSKGNVLSISWRIIVLIVIYSLISLLFFLLLLLVQILFSLPPNYFEASLLFSASIGYYLISQMTIISHYLFYITYKNKYDSLSSQKN